MKTRMSKVSVFLLVWATATAAVAQPPASRDSGPAAQPAAGDAGPPAPAPDAGAAALPWAGAQDAPPPTWLDTTDRRIQDERPPPSAEQVRALREMEAEVGRFTKTGSSYRDTVVSIVRREYLRQRRERDQGYATQIREEERLQNVARERAIRLFERFIARYPDDPTYTPDAMFRLGELYYERSAIRFQEAYEARQDDGDQRDDAQRDSPDFNDTINLYQQLVERFPNYRRIDGVYYLIGYCLNEMGRQEEARLAWLNLVCSNRYTYRPSEYAAQRQQQLLGDGSVDEPDAGASHPAAALDQPAQPAAEDAGPFVDPFEGCTPILADTRFLAETWLRIGEYHFDFDFGPHGLDRAISAYRKVLAMPDDRNYNLALYKIAWAYYRASRYPEAIRHFSDLVQWSDEEQERTGRAGSELRAEAILYLGIAMAYDDWNENQVPDQQEGLVTGPAAPVVDVLGQRLTIDEPGARRIQDPSLMPQDRRWTAEVYFQLGNIYFDEAKYPQAIAIWRMALQRWPNSPQAPEIANMVARAYTRHNDMENALRQRAELSQYGEGVCAQNPNCWWNQNVDHPTEQRLAEQLAENSLIGTAVHHHQTAQRLRRECVEALRGGERDPQRCRDAQERYRLAAEAYRGYIQRYPNNPQAYELQYNLADALYWSENYEEAAREYGAVRDSNLDDTHLSESARRVVESLKRMVDAAVARGEFQIREEPPPAAGTPPRVAPVQMPQLLQRLAQAREIYLARVDERRDTENVRESYDYNNTLLLYLYGYWPQARERFQRIYELRCRGPQADETGQVAWVNLRNMAVALGNLDEAERLSVDLRERRCTFRADATEPVTVDCSREENANDPQCIALGTLNAARYRRALDIYRRAESASGQEQLQLYEQSATMLVGAVNEVPNDPQAPLALEYAATALERTSRFESAARLYQRIIDEVGPRRAANPEEQERLDNILANAYFRLAFNANRFFDYDRAVENYRTLADSPRFTNARSTRVQEFRTDALINTAKILEYQQQYARAAEYYRRAADRLSGIEQVTANFRIAEMAYRQRNWGETVRQMQAFIARYGSNREAGELVVTANWRIAQARQAQNNQREYRVALQNVVDAFGRSGQAPGSLAAEYAAEARFRLVDTGVEDFESFRINSGRPATMEAYVKGIKAQIEDGSRRAKTLAESYNPVTAYRRPTWTIAAYVQQGRIYEVLARAVLNTPFVMPADLARRVRGAPREAQEEVRLQVEDAIRAAIDQQVRPIECLAVARYVLAARAARQGSMDTSYTRTAVERLQAYGEERIQECVAQAAATDPSFRAAEAGEFQRAPPGRTQDMRPGVAAPPLAPED